MIEIRMISGTAPTILLSMNLNTGHLSAVDVNVDGRVANGRGIPVHQPPATPGSAFEYAGVAELVLTLHVDVQARDVLLRGEDRLGRKQGDS